MPGGAAWKTTTSLKAVKNYKEPEVMLLLYPNVYYQVYEKLQQFADSHYD